MGDRASAEQLIQQGLNFYDGQDLPQAQASYLQAIAADPTFPMGYNNLAMVLIDLEQYEEAIHQTCIGLALDSSYGELYNNLGFALRRTGQDFDAAIVYNQYLALEPDVEEGPKIQQWIQKVMQDNGQTELPNFQLPEHYVGVAQQLHADAGTAPAAVELEAAPEMPPLPPMSATPSMVLGMPHTETQEVAIPSTASQVLGVQEPPPPPPAPAAKKEEPPKVKKMPPWQAAMVNPEAPEAANFKNSGSGVPPPAPSAPAPAPVAAAPEPAPPPPVAKPLPKLPPVGSVPLPKPPGPGGLVPIAPVSSMPQPADPAEVLALLEAGLDQFGTGNMSAALATFEQALTKDGMNSEAHTGRGKCLVRLERSEEGMQAFRKAMELDPEDPAPCYVLGFSLREQGKEVEAADAYTRFLHLLPAAEEATRMREWINQINKANGLPELIGPSVAAKPALDENKVEDNEQIVTENDQKYQKAVMAFQEDDVEQAQRLAMKVLHDEAGHTRTRILLGRILIRQKAYDQAAAELFKAVEARPNNAEGQYFLGQAYEKMNQNDQARDCYEKALQLNPQGPRADRLREWLSTQTGGSSNTGQAQCEMCLRFYPSTELKKHAGKQTCHSCLVLMGVEKSSGAGLAPAPSRNAEATVATGTLPEPPEDDKPRVKAGGMGAKIVVVGILLLLVGGSIAKRYLSNWFGGKISNAINGTVNGNNPNPNPNPNVNPNTASVSFNKNNVKPEGEPAGLVLPFSTWTYKPTLKGMDGAPDVLKVEYTLKKSPEGMTVDAKTGEVTWPFKPANLEELAAGKEFPVELEIAGILPDEPESDKYLFRFLQSFTLKSQFGYAPGTDVDVAWDAATPAAVATGSFSGSGKDDLVLGTGRFGRGQIQFHLQSASPVPPPLIFPVKDQPAALGTANIESGDSLLVAYRYSGKVQLFMRDEKQMPKPGPSFIAGQGPVALAVADFAKDKKPMIGVLLSLGQALVVSKIDNGQFSAPSSIPLPWAGHHGELMPWVSKEKGPGFVALIPFSSNPLQYVSCAAGRPLAPVATKMEGLCPGAAALFSKNEKIPPMMAVLQNVIEGEVVQLEEKSGQFTPMQGSANIKLGGFALHCASADFNKDGLDDLVVSTREGLKILFNDGQGLKPGYSMVSTEGLDGSLGVADWNGDGFPDVIALKESGRALLFLSRAGVPAPATVTTKSLAKQEDSAPTPPVDVKKP